MFVNAQAGIPLGAEMLVTKSVGTIISDLNSQDRSRTSLALVHLLTHREDSRGLTQNAVPLIKKLSRICASKSYPGQDRVHAAMGLMTVMRAVRSAPSETIETVCSHSVVTSLYLRKKGILTPPEANTINALALEIASEGRQLREPARNLHNQNIEILGVNKQGNFVHVPVRMSEEFYGSAGGYTDITGQYAWDTPQDLVTYFNEYFDHYVVFTSQNAYHSAVDNIGDERLVRDWL